MKILTPRKLNSMLALLSAVLMLSCSSSEEYIEPPTEPEPPTEIEGEEKTYPEAWHDKMRTRPYPQIDNELIINPSPLIVPMNMKVSDSLKFELSQDPNFETSVTQSAMQAWCMYNPHRTLETEHGTGATVRSRRTEKSPIGAKAINSKWKEIQTTS